MQVAFNVLVASSTILLLAVGFSLIFGTTRFFHFAHAAVFVVSAYGAHVSRAMLGLPVWAACLFGVAAGVVLGCLIELGIYRWLRRREASALVLLLASMGLYIVLQNAVSMIFGDDTKVLRSGAVEEGWAVLGARITPISVLIVCVSAVLTIGTAVLLRKTGLGRAMRAVADDSELARICGLPTDRVILATFAVGSALAGAAGVLVALDVSMTPTMGMNALMMAIVAVIIGGVGSISGVVLGAVLLASVQQLAIWQFGSQWQDAVAFVLLLLFLLARPQGFMGKPLRKMAV